MPPPLCFDLGEPPTSFFFAGHASRFADPRRGLRRFFLPTCPSRVPCRAGIVFFLFFFFPPRDEEAFPLRAPSRTFVFFLLAVLVAYFSSFLSRAPLELLARVAIARHQLFAVPLGVDLGLRSCFFPFSSTLMADPALYRVFHSERPVSIDRPRRLSFLPPPSFDREAILAVSTRSIRVIRMRRATPNPFCYSFPRRKTRNNFSLLSPFHPQFLIAASSI